MEDTLLEGREPTDPLIDVPTRGEQPTKAHEGLVVDRRYRLVKKLGEGGMGEVWRATQEIVDRPVAMKLLHRSLMTSTEIQARFEVEARAIGRLKHTHCVTLFDFGYCNILKTYFMVLEYVEGETLAEVMSRRLLTLNETIELGIQTADALDHAHEQGIMHRDIKPENIMISGEDNSKMMVKVLDFGIARLVDSTDEEGEEEEEKEEDNTNSYLRENRITRAGQIFGTPVYMSPEQATGKYSFGPQCDIYSLGIIFYELLTGAPPFDDPQAIKILLQHVTQPLPPLTSPKIPEPLKVLITEMLEKIPSNRTETAREVKERLLQIQRELIGDTGAVSTVTPYSTLHPAEGNASDLTSAPKPPDQNAFDDVEVTSLVKPTTAQALITKMPDTKPLFPVLYFMIVATVVFGALFLIWNLLSDPPTSAPAPKGNREAPASPFGRPSMGGGTLPTGTNLIEEEKAGAVGKPTEGAAGQKEGKQAQEVRQNKGDETTIGKEGGETGGGEKAGKGGKKGNAAGEQKPSNTGASKNEAAQTNEGKKGATKQRPKKRTVKKGGTTASNIPVFDLEG